MGTKKQGKYWKPCSD